MKNWTSWRGSAVRRGLFVALLSGMVLDLTGCDRPATGLPSSPRVAGKRGGGIQVISSSVAPAVPRLSRYGEVPNHALAEGESALSLRLEPLGIVHDPALSRMVRSLAENTPSRFDMPPELIDGLMAWNGLLDPPPSIVVIELAADPEACALRADGPCAQVYRTLVEEVEHSMQGRDNLRFGVGFYSDPKGPTRLTVALIERGIDLRSMPAHIEVTETFELRGKLLGRRSSPRVEVVDARGKHARLAAAIGDDGSIVAMVGCMGGEGKHQVEVLADGAHGPEIVANFPLYCGVDPPSKIDFSYERLSAEIGPKDVIHGNFSYLNEERQARKLPALKWDIAAAQVAQDHSQDMADHGFMGHVSPTTGDATRRFERAKIAGTVIRENVARGYGPRGIHLSLMNSPGHRVNMLATDITHVGIGVIFGEPETEAKGAPRPVFLTQNFYAKIGADLPRNLSREISRRVDDRRKDAGLVAVEWVSRASSLAQARADALAEGKVGKPDEQLAEALFDLGFSAVDRRQVQSTDWRALSELEFWEQPGTIRLGLGVARRSEALEGGFIMVLVVDARR